MNAKLLALKLYLDQLGIDSCIDTLDDRKRVQKAVYLAQVATQIDLGYRFGWYLRGPYSTSLTKDYFALSEAVASGQVNPEGKALQRTLRDRLDQFKPILAPPADVSLPQEDWLELLSSVHFLRKVSRFDTAKAEEVINTEKPHLKSFLVAAQRELRSTGLLAD